MLNSKKGQKGNTPESEYATKLISIASLLYLPKFNYPLENKELLEKSKEYDADLLSKENISIMNQLRHEIKEELSKDESEELKRIRALKKYKEAKERFADADKVIINKSQINTTKVLNEQSAATLAVLFVLVSPVKMCYTTAKY